jgi:hypothetical protein
MASAAGGRPEMSRSAEDWNSQQFRTVSRHWWHLLHIAAPKTSSLVPRGLLLDPEEGFASEQRGSGRPSHAGFLQQLLSFAESDH